MERSAIRGASSAELVPACRCAPCGLRVRRHFARSKATTGMERAASKNLVIFKISLYRNSEMSYVNRNPSGTRGESRVVTVYGWGAVDAGSVRHAMARGGQATPVNPRLCADERRACVRQNCVVLAVVATVKPLRKTFASPTGRTASLICGGEGGQREDRLPGERSISRQPTAQGRPGVRPHLYAAVQLSLRVPRTADRGCQAGTRPSLRPRHFLRGRSVQQTSGGSRRENEGACRQCAHQDTPRLRPILRDVRLRRALRRGRASRRDIKPSR
jgi:hypothetical protein